MSIPLRTVKLRVCMEKRILNEVASKVLNEERMSKVIDERGRSQRLSNFAEMNFHCECDEQTCREAIYCHPGSRAS